MSTMHETHIISEKTHNVADIFVSGAGLIPNQLFTLPFKDKTVIKRDTTGVFKYENTCVCVGGG